VLDVTDDRDALADVEPFVLNAVFVELVINVESLTEVVVLVVGVVGVGDGGHGDVIVVLVVPVVVVVALAIQIQN